MFFSGLDLRYLFYHLSLPDELCPYFQLPPIRAYFLHQQGCCYDFPASAMVYPFSRSFPWDGRMRLMLHSTSSRE